MVVSSIWETRERAGKTKKAERAGRAKRGGRALPNSKSLCQQVVVAATAATFFDLNGNPVRPGIPATPAIPRKSEWIFRRDQQKVVAVVTTATFPQRFFEFR